MTDLFGSLGLRKELADTVVSLGYTEPTPIQKEAIPALLKGKDLLGQAATGTGKTAAFALPLLDRLAETADRSRPKPNILVLVPTRELAVQVSEAMKSYSKALKLQVVAIFGGQSFEPQLRALKNGVHVIVATPGRALDHIKRKTLKLGEIQAVVLDEADEMLDMGFAEDLETILGELPEERQTALFSATMPPRIAHIAERHLKDPVRVSIAKEKTKPGASPRIRQNVFLVKRSHKLPALSRLLDFENPASTIIFCRTRVDVDELATSLNGRGYTVETLHGGMSQTERDRVMKRVRNQHANLLIATDVAARGLDIDHLTHVINFDVPTSPDVYVHRIGRTGRAGREGTAFTFADPGETRLIRNVERLMGQKLDTAAVPSVEQARGKRLEQTREALRNLSVDKGLEGYGEVLDSLKGEIDIRTVALAAIKLAHEATVGKVDETVIPENSAGGNRREKRERGEREPRNSTRERSRGSASGTMGTIYVSAGRKDQIRAGDLLGVLTNHVGLEAGSVGNIKINDRFSLVEVPEENMDSVIEKLNSSMIRGVKVGVRRDRDEGESAPRSDDRPRRSSDRERAPRRDRPSSERRGPRGGGERKRYGRR